MRDLFDRERPKLLSKGIICMVNLLEKPRVIVFFLHYIFSSLNASICQKKSCVLSSGHKNQVVATIGTLLDQFMLSCK